jgi:phosphatidylglycerol lysyltransferase
VVFMPTSERFAHAVAGKQLRVHKVGASPYFDLQTWDPHGNSAKGLRLGLNRARKAGVTVEPLNSITDGLRREVAKLCDEWLDARPAGIEFGWLFRLAPFENWTVKKYFTARTEDGRLVGLLAASPIPAREGWYLEDVLRTLDAPVGTADLLVFEVLRSLAAQGAKIATLGTVPLSEIGTDNITAKSFFVQQTLSLIRKNLGTVYNIEGLRCFKSKFVPSWWESEYVVVSKGVLQAPRTGLAILGAIFGNCDGVYGLYALARKALFPRPRVLSGLPKTAAADMEAENSLNQKSHAIVELR